MRAFVFAAILAVALAAEFSVKDADKKTCALLKLDGSLDVNANKDGKLVLKKSLVFSDATLMANSTCKLIMLDLKESGQMWFKFDADSKNWKVTPITAFVPEELFGTLVNDTEEISMTAAPLAPFPQSESYLCKASTTVTFSATQSAENYTYDATAQLTGFQIQSVESDTFKAGSECPADKKPAEYVCKNAAGKNMVEMVGNLTLVINYNRTDDAGKTVAAVATVSVPKPQDATTTGNCAVNATTQTLSIGFSKDWAVNFEFTKKDDFYHISNITVNFVYDSHFPNATEKGSKTVVLLNGKDTDYLKASNKGYYLCNANLNKMADSVTLTSKNFKYRAFDKDSKGFKSGSDVTECSADEDTSSVVPIAVGAALAGLVVIVLVAYLIGRKRSRKTGYESV